MKKVLKGIKLYESYTDEEKSEFAEYFKPEEEPKKDEPKKVEVPVKETVKEEVKVEEKKYVSMEDFATVVKELNEFKEKLPKLKEFGAKAKQGEGKDDNSFDSLFANLTQGQT